MIRKKILSGNLAASYGVKMSRVEVISVYPISPQTEIADTLASFITSGKMQAKYITPESEHSVMQILAGASAAGARVFTASSSQGIAYMEEVLWMVAGLRLPIVMAVCNRSIAFPSRVLCSHSDSLLQRDNGWIQLYCESGQEVLDTCIQSYKIAENENVYLPVMFCFDGYITTHMSTPIELADQSEVDEFLPPYEHKFVQLDPTKPQEITYGLEAFKERETEYRYQMEEAMVNAKKIILEVDEEFGQRFGRRYGGLLETYRCENADGLIITMGSMTATAREVVDEMREEEKQIGLVKLKSFRPFPTEELRKLARDVEAVGVIDRNFSHGSAGGGISLIETARALYSLKKRPYLQGFVAGLGGRDITPPQIKYMAENVLKTAKTGEVEREVEWIQLDNLGGGCC